MSRAIYAFSGDPITYGHINLVERACKTFDSVTVAIGENPEKTYTFSLAERKTMAKQCLRHLKNVEVVSFEGLLVDFAYEQDIPVIIKGVRNSSDFNYEETLHHVGGSQGLGIDTHILFADPTLAHVSSSVVKGMYKNNHAEVHKFVPLYVKQQLEWKLSKQVLIGVTGEMASGKSTFCEIASSLAMGWAIYNIDLDAIVHDILSSRSEPMYARVRWHIAELFGQHMLKNGGIDRKALGDRVFADKKKLEDLNSILREPMLVRLRKKLRGKRGIILINAALLAEADMLYLCNNNVIMTTTHSSAVLIERYKERGLTDPQIAARIDCQYTEMGKKKKIQKAVHEANHGFLITHDTSDSKKDRTKIEAKIRSILEYNEVKYDG